MKRFLFLLITALLICNTTNAESEIFTAQTAEGVTMFFRVVSSQYERTCEVYGVKQNTIGKVTVPEFANNYAVVGIGDKAFYKCQGITEVILSHEITYIGGSAFEDCLSLHEIVIPNSVRWIGERAFNECSNLISVTLPDNITSIGNYTFHECFALSSINMPSKLEKIGSDAFRSCISIKEIKLPNSLTTIGSSAFYGCKGITSIYLPASVNNIGENPFADCNYLESISVASDNTTYDSRDNCNAIIETAQNTLVSGCKKTVIPEGITTINSRAFDGCLGMTTLHIPASLVNLGYLGDGFVKDMESITVASGNPVYDSRNNCNAIIETATSKLLMGCKNTVIPEGVTEIGSYAFEWCAGLKKIAIPNSVTTIGKSAFSHSGLQSVTIPASVNSMGKFCLDRCVELTTATILGPVKELEESTFEYCIRLETITLPESLETIDSDVFYYCSKLSSISIPASVKSINGNAFKGCQDLSSIQIAKGNKVYNSGSNNDAIFRGTSLILATNNTVIPAGTTSIEKNAYDNCTSLKTLNIPRSMRNILSNFSSCTELETITVDKANATYDSRNDCNALISTADSKLIKGCKNTVIPEDIKCIGSMAFTNCPIKSVTIPSTVVKIEPGAFYNCSQLERVISHIQEPFELDSLAFVTYKIISFNNMGFLENYDNMTTDEFYNFYFDPTYDEENNQRITEFSGRNAILYVPKNTLSKYQATSCWNMFKEIRDTEPSSIDIIERSNPLNEQPNDWYNLSGQRLNTPQKGINIVNGKKVVIK